MEGEDGDALTMNRPLVSIEVNGKPFQSDKPSTLAVFFKHEAVSRKGIKGAVVFKNISADTLVNCHGLKPVAIDNLREVGFLPDRLAGG